MFTEVYAPFQPWQLSMARLEECELHSGPYLLSLEQGDILLLYNIDQSLFRVKHFVPCIVFSL